MSLHKSFSGKGRVRRHRNVLTRAERLARLAEEGRRFPADSVFGLPKVRSIKPKKKAKAAKKAGAETPATAAAATPAAAAPEKEAKMVKKAAKSEGKASDKK